jgi:N-sulfoglucosamine sulfohydrolase
MLQLKQAGGLNKETMSYFYLPRPAEELYDLEKDPYELTNLINAPAHAQVAARMRTQMNKIRQATHDQLPAKRTLDEFDRNTGLPLPNRVRPRPSKAGMTSDNHQPARAK